MEITLDKIDKTEALIKVKLKEDDYQPGVTEKIKEYSKKANIKGFRPGKVPSGLIKKLYGKSILAEEINKLLSEKLNAYLKESDLQFLGEPLPREDSFAGLDLDQPKEFEFEYNVGFAEEFDLKVDNKIKLVKHTIKVDDPLIDETVQNLQKQFGTPAEAGVSEAGDILYGPVYSKDERINKEINIDLQDVEKSFLKKLTGLKPGDSLEFDPKKLYKDSHQLHHQLAISHDEFENMKEKLSFKLTKITRIAKAQVNQDLFDKAFGKDSVKSETEFRDRIKEVLTQNYKNEEEQFFNHQIRKELISKAKINLPDNFLKKWLTRSNDTITEEVLNAEYTSYAEELKWSLIKNKLVKVHQLKVENNEVVDGAKKLIAAQFGQAGLLEGMGDRLDAFAHNYLQGENGENYMKVYNQVLNHKVFDKIKEEISVKEKAVSLEEFKKL